MLHHNRTKPDKTGQPLSIRGPVTKLSPNVTNRRSHHKWVTTLVTNNGLFTRKIPFVTAPTPHKPFVTAPFIIVTALSPTGERVTKSPWALALPWPPIFGR